MKFAIVITGAHYQSQAPQTAYHFTLAALRAGHQVTRIFLYGNGVHLATLLAAPAADEANWCQRWQQLIAEHQLPATVCVASALRRGLVDAREARRQGLSCSNIHPCFEVAGLGDWVEAHQQADRVVYFNENH